MVSKIELKYKKDIYDKNKSFVDIHVNQFKLSKNNLADVKKVLNDKNLINKIDKDYKDIIVSLKEDIFEKNNNSEKGFKLTPNILNEFETLDYNKRLNFLIHRYRYDVYPQKYLIDKYPPYLQIEPTSFCNYRCVFCFQTNKNFTKRSNGFMGHMKLETFKLIVDKVINKVEFISLASRGDPLICRDIEKMLAYTNDKFLNLKINTNASLLNENKIHAILSSGEKTLVFSADAADEKLYAKLRVNGDLKKVLKNIELFNKIKHNKYKNSKIITRVSGVKVNDSQNFNKMRKFWGNLVDQVAFVDYCPWEDVYSQKVNTIKSPCSELWRRMYIWWDGKVNPCEVDFKSDLAVGNIFKNDLSDLWLSKGYNLLRKNHLNEERQKSYPCSSCVVT